MTSLEHPSNAGQDDLWLRPFLSEVRQYAILLLDERGIVGAATAGVESVFGHRPAEIVGRHVSLVFPPEVGRGGLPDNILATARARGQFEKFGLALRKDGTVFDADIVVRALRDDEAGKGGFGMIVRDISARVEATDLVQASESRLQSLVDTVLDTLVDGLIIIDRGGRIQLYNRACVGLFGYPVDEVLGRNVRMLMPPDMSAEHDSFLKNYQHTGLRKIIGISREVMGQRRDGSQFPMHLAVGETSHQGEPIYVGIIRDLTERNRTEEQLRQSQKMEAVGQLTGGIAHDFNNILMVVMANADALLEDDRLDRQTLARAEQIAAATQRAADLTRQLLAFSRKQTLRPVPIQVDELVAATSRLLGRTLGEHIEVEVDLERGWPVVIDRGQLEAALINLCLNARDAMPEGGRLLIETRNLDLGEDRIGEPETMAPGAYVMIGVTDNGVGMPPETLERVFEPFFTTKDVGKGTGLGLSMVYGFIRQSQGYVHIYSEVGHGTTVRLYLPAGQALAIDEAHPDDLVTPGGEERVLVVEDNAQVRAGVVEQLRSLGYAVEEAANGAMGLAACENAASAPSGPFDLVLTDVVMPGAMGGRALAAEIEGRWPSTAVIFMSGFTELAASRQGGLPPGAPLLEKPFRKRDLARLVRTILDGRS